MNAPVLTICEYLDPGCPFCFAHEAVRLRLTWLFAEQLEWEIRVIGLSRDESEYPRKGFTPEKQVKANERLARRFGMPYNTDKDRLLVTGHACRAVVAVDRYRPDLSRQFLRELMIAFHSRSEYIDEIEVLLEVAQGMGLDPDGVAQWISDGETTELLEAHYAAARTPTAAALAQPDRLGKDADGTVRYAGPSLEITSIESGTTYSVPGKQPIESYEAAIANLAPELARRNDPETVGEVLAWATMPLATAEVAAIGGRTLDQARGELKKVATFTEVGSDGYWSVVPITSGVRG